MSSSGKKQSSTRKRNAALANLTFQLSVSQDKQIALSGHSKRSCSSKQVPSMVTGSSRRPQECVEAGPMAYNPGSRNNSANLYREGQIVKLGSSVVSHIDSKNMAIVVNPEHSSSSVANTMGCDPCHGKSGEIRNKCANLHEIIKTTKRKKKRSKSNQVPTVQANDKPSPSSTVSTDFPRLISNVQAKKSSCVDARNDVSSEIDITTRSMPKKYNPFGPGKGASASESVKTIAASSSVKHLQRCDFSIPTTSNDSVAACLSAFESLRKRKLNSHSQKTATANITHASFKKDLSQAELINRYDRAHPNKVRDVEGAPSYYSLKLDQRIGNERAHTSQSCDGSRRVKSLKSCALNSPQSNIALSAVGHGNQRTHGMWATGSRSAAKIHVSSERCSDSSRPPSRREALAKTGIQSEKLTPDHDGWLEDASMEWEDIEDEKVLQNIKVLRECCQNDEDQLIEDMDTNCLDVSNDSGVDCLIVLDTNILISHLKFVAELSKQEYKAVGCPILVIPWMVLKELDTLKGGRSQSKVRSFALESKARTASHFINGCFSSRHSRVKGQSAIEDREHCIEIDVPDDSILNCCLQLQMKGKRVILLSNDVNFCNKAMASGIASFGKEQLSKALAFGSIDLGDAEPKNLSHGVSSPQTKTDIKLHKTYTKCEDLLKNFLSKLIETEMKRVFKDWWIKIIYIKPPWSLLDSLRNLSKHWIAVFDFIMDKSGYEVVQDLIAVFTKGNPSEAEKVIQLAVSLCGAIISDDYKAMAEEFKNSLMSLVEVRKEYKTGDTEGTPASSCSQPEKPAQAPQIPAFLSDKLEVFEIFQFLWNLVNNFCGVVCDTFGLEHNIPYEKPQKNPPVEEVKERIPEALNYIATIVTCLSGILETPETHLSVEHPLLSNLLSLILTGVPPEFLVEKAFTREKLLMFCTDDCTRLMLSNGISQFGEVQMKLLKVMNILG